MEARPVAIEPHDPMPRKKRRVDTLDGERVEHVTSLPGTGWTVEDEDEAIDEGGGDELSLQSDDPLVIFDERIGVLERDIADVKTVLQFIADALERGGLWSARETAELDRLRAGSA